MKHLFHFKVTIIILCFISFCFSNISAQTKLKVACVGNSITYGYGIASPATQSYPAQLLALLDPTKWAVENFGVSARTMLKKGNLPYWNEPAYTNAKAYLPNFVVIELGTNDAKTPNWDLHGKEFTNNYKEMINVFRNLPSKPDVWIGLVPPGQHISWTIRESYLKDSVNSRIKQIALESGVGLIDIFDAFNGKNPNWFNSSTMQSDSIHPTVAGAGIIAQKVKEVITRAKPTLKCLHGKIIAPTANAYQWYYNGSIISKKIKVNGNELVPTKIGKYKVSLKINANNETRIVSDEIEIKSLTRKKN